MRKKEWKGVGREEREKKGERERGEKVNHLKD
jgi:hypothetical protein